MEGKAEHVDCEYDNTSNGLAYIWYCQMPRGETALAAIPLGSGEENWEAALFLILICFGFKCLFELRTWLGCARTVTLPCCNLALMRINRDERDEIHQV